jgi:hypothetical protein
MRGLLVLGFLLAIGAVAVAVFSDDVRLLKLAALLGVWAALATAFPVVYFRRSARAAEQKTKESKRTYELELHREISARRDYVVGVSEAAREDAETRHREELAGLREQLDRLNTTLSALLDGELLFERLTLSAESTRVRQVGSEGGRGLLAAMARPDQIEHASESTGPHLGHQSGAPVSVGPAVGVPGTPYPVHEDATVQFLPATVGPVGPPDPGPSVEAAVVEPAVAAPLVEPPVAAAPADAAEPEPEPEPVAEEPQPDPVLEDPALVAEAAEPERMDAGAGHSAGISVADLLAAFGGGEGAPRRRRRAQD